MHKEGENSKYLLNEKSDIQGNQERNFLCKWMHIFKQINKGDKISNDLTKKYTPIFIDEIESLNIDSIRIGKRKLIASSNKFNCYTKIF